MKENRLTTSSDELQNNSIDVATNQAKNDSGLRQMVEGMKDRVAQNTAENLAQKHKAAAYANTAYQVGTSAETARLVEAMSTPKSQNYGSADAFSEATISNAKAIAKHTVFGVNHLVDLRVVVEGQILKNFLKYTLHQTIKGHHEFELHLSYDTFGEDETYEMERAQKLLGKRILIMTNFKNIAEKPERDFIGVITEVRFEQEHGSKGCVVLKGSSPTILLDMAPHIQSFGGSNAVPLSTVVLDILNQGYTQNGKYNYMVKCTNNINLSYACQYNETPYNFLARTAEAYGEQFYYNGNTLYFGELPQPEEPIQLVYGRDVGNVQIRMQARHVNRAFYGYNSSDNEKLSATGTTKLEVKGTLAKVAYQKSEETFTSPSLQSAPIKASTNQDITQVQKGAIASEGMNVFVTSGTTTVPFLYPGCIVSLSMLKPTTKEKSHFTKVMITAINHTVDALGSYKGEFEAVDADTGFIPRIAYTQPNVEQQVATVVSNQDPQNKGRVQVQFDWQNTSLNTEFIRVMTPDAGSSDKVGTNRGFMAIPEVGDQVMVGFIANHPDRPYVMGGLFHGKSGAGGGAGNNIKSLSSKSGHTLELNDAGGVKIEDKNKNIVHLDGEGNIFITSATSIALQSGESSLVLQENGNIIMTGLKLYMNGNTITTTATEELTNVSGGANLTLKSEGSEALLSAKESTVSGSNTATMSGGRDAKVISEGIASIEGAIVKLN